MTQTKASRGLSHALPLTTTHYHSEGVRQKYVIWVGNQTVVGNTILPSRAGNAFCANLTSSGQGAYRYNVDCVQPLVGRYVVFQRANTAATTGTSSGTVALCEVQVR